MASDGQEEPVVVEEEAPKDDRYDADGKPARTFPYCITFLVVAAISSHSAVLGGNLLTANMMKGLGDSVGGWSSVGLAVSEGLTDLDENFGDAVVKLTGTLEQVMAVKETLDTTLLAIGQMSDAMEQGKSGSLLQVGSFPKDLESLLQLSVECPRGGDCGKGNLMAPGDGKSPLNSFLEGWAQVQPASPKPKGALLHGGKHITFDQLNITVKVPESEEELQEQVELIMEKVAALLDVLMEFVKPVLMKCATWMTSFGPGMQAKIEAFTTTLDFAQKTFDQVMKQLSGESKGKDILIWDTYVLFDTAKTGLVKPQDLQDVAKMYGISALQGSKANELHAKYDKDKDGSLDEEEYDKFVDDPTVPSIMSGVLRKYASKLVEIAGSVDKARLRDGVAEAVRRYLTLVVSKNKTKVTWVSEYLTNGTVPKEFTADVMKQFAEDLENPNRLTMVDVGQTIMNRMVDLNEDHVTTVLEMMGTTEFWISEGFDLAEQPDLVAQVAHWVDAAKEEKKSSRRRKSSKLAKHDDDADDADKTADASKSKRAALLETVECEQEGTFHYEIKQAAEKHDLSVKAAAKMVLQGKARKHHVGRVKARSARVKELRSSAGARKLFDKLLGGRIMSHRGDPEAEMAVNGGVMAKPETLAFAQWLSGMAYATAKMFEQRCFDYEQDTSSSMSSFADTIGGMNTKVTSVLNNLQKYASPKGIRQIESDIDNFGSRAAKEIVNALVADAKESGSDRRRKQKSLIQVSDPGEERDLMKDLAAGDKQGAFVTLKTLLDEFMVIMPTVIISLKEVKDAVSGMSAQVGNVFDAAKTNAPPVFFLAGTFYAALWTAYFTLFATMTLLVLFYGFWANGWFGGPKARVEEEVGEYEPPVTMKEKLIACCFACTGRVRRGKECCTGTIHWCCSFKLCFWSCLLFAQVIVLVLFLVSVLLCLLSGIKMFIAAGCAQVYIIGDDGVCTGVLQTMQQWLEKFEVIPDLAVDRVCGKAKLLTCKMIADEAAAALVLTVVGSLMAAVFSFYMIIESACLHEQARWRLIFDEVEDWKMES